MNEEYLQTLQLGEACVTILTLALLRWDLEQQMPIPRQERPARYAHLFEQPSQVPVRCVHISLPGVSLLVDACTSTAFLGTEYEQPGAPVYPDLLDQLASAGVSAEEITHVVITHHHFDHIIGLTRKQGEVFVPCFPRARHYLGHADWEVASVQEALGRPDSVVHSTLAVLQHQGLLELVDGDHDLGHGLRILHTPGETPGHQILRLEADGHTLYCLGDLYHHLVEIEQPTWMAPWDDSATMLPSRQRLTQAALAENALLVAAHIPTVGGLGVTADGVCWEARTL
ncbi:MAG: MBL fold metallo-hydrolase [Ktedonobacteraceae bacterium]